MQELIKDLIELQADLPKVEKSGTNPHFGNSYMKLEDLTAALLPVLKENNFAWVTRPDSAEDGSPTLKYTLYHTTGEKIEGEMKLVLSKQDPQGQGSAITYARRYALCAVTGLVADLDDDGNAASEPEAKKPMYAKKEPVAEPKITPEQIAKLLGAIKLKGFIDKTQAMNILNNFAKSVGNDRLIDLTYTEAEALYGTLVLTKKEALEMFVEDSMS